MGDQLPNPLVFQILPQADFFQWLPIVRKFDNIYEMMTVIIIDCNLIAMMMIMRIDD